MEVELPEMYFLHSLIDSTFILSTFIDFESKRRGRNAPNWWYHDIPIARGRGVLVSFF